MSVFSDRPPQSPLSPASAHPDKRRRSTDNHKILDGLSSHSDKSKTESELNLEKKKQYTFDDLKEVCTLGTGSFGTVKLVHHESSGDAMALVSNVFYDVIVDYCVLMSYSDASMYYILLQKILKKDTIVEFRQEKNILSEKQLLLECTRCPFIVNLISTFNHANKLYMLMELVQGGELLTHLYDRADTIPKSSFGGFTIECNTFYLANILLAFEFMHSKDIIYRDLKPENILVNNDGYIKLADFGFAKVIPYATSEGEVITKTYTIVGSPEYMAPEMLNNLGYDECVDYWSLGCLIFELVFANSLFADPGGYPLLTQENVRKSTKESICQSFPDAFKEEHAALYELTTSFLVPDPSGRACFKDMTAIRSSKVFTHEYWSDVEERKIKPFYIPSIEHHLDASNFYDFDEEDEEEAHEVQFDGDQSVFDLF
jgi:serine/threonine protein kinase